MFMVKHRLTLNPSMALQFYELVGIFTLQNVACWHLEVSEQGKHNST